MTRGRFASAAALAAVLIMLARCQGEGIVELAEVSTEADALDSDQMWVEDALPPDGADPDVLATDLDRPGDQDNDPDSGYDLVPEILFPPAPLATCDAQPAWELAAEPYALHYGDAWLYVSPDGQTAGVQSAMGQEYFETLTGVSKAQDPEGALAGLEGDWTRFLRMDEKGVSVFAANSEDPMAMLSYPPPADLKLTWMAGGQVTLSSDMKWAAAVVCWRAVGLESSETRLGVWSLQDGQLVRNVDLQQECQGSYWLDRPLVLVSGDNVVARMPDSGLVHVVSILGDGHTQRDLAQGLAPVPFLGGDVLGYVPYLSPVVRFAPSADGLKLAAVTHDGVVRFFTLPDLLTVGPEIAAGFSGINMFTYGPSIASPLAWSADGSLLAHMSPSGQARVSRTTDGKTLFSIPNPSSTSAGAPPEMLNPPIALRFVDQDSALLVVHESGRQRWQCPP